MLSNHLWLGCSRQALNNVLVELPGFSEYLQELHTSAKYLNC